MKSNLTELVFIIDRSGSMSGLEKDTIGGYNGFIEKQKAEPSEAVLSTVLFDNQYELLHNRQDIKTIAPLTQKEYFVRGTTALLDAIGITITTVEREHCALEVERPEKVLFIIITDGMENSSKEYTVEKIRSMIEQQKEKSAWEFLFLGANIDAIGTAQNFGIAKERAVQFHCDSAGIDECYHAIEMSVSHFRNSNKISDNWKEKIEIDFEERGK